MWRILGEGPEDSFDLAVPGAVTHLGFLQRGAVLPGIAEVRVAAVGEQPPDAGVRWPFFLMGEGGPGCRALLELA